LKSYGGKVKVTNEKVENRQAYLTIAMETGEVAEYADKAYKSLVKKVNIPGFRRGKAPRPMVERYLGPEKFKEETLNILIPDAFNKAIAREKIEAFAQPTFNLEKTDAEVVFKTVVPLAPIVTVGDYRSIKMTPEPVNVTEENTSMAIEQLRHQHATWEPVERPVAYGDMVVMDITSTVEGQTFLDRQGAQYGVTRDSPLPIPGFSAALVDMKREEEKEFSLVFPADFARPELANKEAHFKVKINEIKQEKLLELNDEFAALIKPELNTLADLKKAVFDDLKRQMDTRARLVFENKLVEKVIELSSAEFPPVIVQIETENMIRTDMQRLETDNFQEYQNTVGKTEKQLREQLEPKAKDRVKQMLVLENIAIAEKLTVSHEEIDEEIGIMLDEATEDRRAKLAEYLATESGHETIGNIILSRKTVAHLARLAQGTVEGAVAGTPDNNKEEEKK
jgi:trigger factor